MPILVKCHDPVGLQTKHLMPPMNHQYSAEEASTKRGFAPRLGLGHGFLCVLADHNAVGNTLPYMFVHTGHLTNPLRKKDPVFTQDRWK